MCGIAGILGYGAGQQPDRVVAMNQIQKHRGPDGEGLYSEQNICLGHRRLAILDVGSQGHQPMSTADNKHVITYNGEIYNYLELKRHYKFHGDYLSHTDTEVLLRALAEQGLSALEYVRGMFAFGLWDSEQKQLLLARDRFGIKPLYYAWHEGKLVFASEIKAILKAGVPAEPDSSTISDYLKLGLYDHRSETFFKGIKRLMPGEYLLLDASAKLLKQGFYYDLKQRIEIHQDEFATHASMLREKLMESFAIHLRSDVEIGINLSGGLDSSALLAMLDSQSQGKAIKCFNKDYQNECYSEACWVEELLNNTVHDCYFCKTDAEQCLSVADKISWYQDEPFGGIPTLAWHSLFSCARDENVTVLLDGSGLDDYLAGYQPGVLRYLSMLENSGNRLLFESESRAYMAFWQVDKAGLQQQLARQSQKDIRINARDGSKAVVPEILNNELLALNSSAGGELSGVEGFSALKQDLLFGLLKSKVPRALRFKDRNSMAFSRELRVPFLDHELVELGLSFPDHHLIREGKNKAVLREALTGLIPDKVNNAVKRTVQSPQREWFQSGAMANALDNVLHEPSDLLKNILNINQAIDCFDAYKNGQAANANYLWQWLNLDIWYRQFFVNKDALLPEWPEAVVEQLQHQQHGHYRMMQLSE